MIKERNELPAANRKRTAVIEIVLILPLVLLLLVGIGNFVFALSDRSQRVSASDEAARAGVVLKISI